MHIDRAITDNRMSRDRFSIASRSSLPFGSGYRSSVAALGSSATVTTEYRLFPSVVLGQPIIYGETAAPIATAFPNGLTSIVIPRIGPNPLPSGTTSLVAIGCVATLNSVPLNGPKAVVMSVSTNASLNVSSGLPLPSDVIALEMTKDGPWVQQGLPGYSITSLVNRALVAGEVLLLGIQPTIVTTALNPTYPEVLLFLWIAIYGSTDGLDVRSVQAADVFCRGRGFFYNGDVRPDRFEAWIYQAAHSHGLRVNRTRSGISLAIMGKPVVNPLARLLTSVNSRSLTRHWQYGDRYPISRIRYGITQDTDDISIEFVPTIPKVILPTRSEELLGVRREDGSHVLALAVLWEEERLLDTRYELELTTDLVKLNLEDVLMISDGTAPRSWQGYSVAQTSQGVMGNWSGVLISGKSDTLTTGTLTDTSKVFDRVTIGDTLELTIAGSIVTATVTNTSGSVVVFTPPLQTIAVEASYRILQTSGSAIVSYQLPGQPIVQTTVTPAYSMEMRSVVYPLASTLPKGTPLAVGELEACRVMKIGGAIVGAVG